MSENSLQIYDDSPEGLMNYVASLATYANSKGLEGIKITNMRLIKTPSKPFSHDNYFIWNEDND